MASKNHPRYKKRKRNNKKTSHIIPDGCVLINGWKDLDGLESETHRIEVDFEHGCGRVYHKEETEDESYYERGMYLSTHTFYGNYYNYSTRRLREMGFNVQLKNWDGETIYYLDKIKKENKNDR